MLILLDLYLSLSLIITYLSVYNITLLVLLNLVVTVFLKKIKTLFSFNNLSFNTYYILLITILLFSIAGVPPFIGFFTKLIIFITIFLNSFFLFYFFFFILLFIGLYFYIQNIRFIHSTFFKYINLPYLHNEKLFLIFYYISIYWLINVIYGYIIFDDLNTYILWIFY